VPGAGKKRVLNSQTTKGNFRQSFKDVAKKGVGEVKVGGDQKNKKKKGRGTSRLQGG